MDWSMKDLMEGGWRVLGETTGIGWHFKGEVET